MSKDAQNVKISSKAWELLRWAKFELNERSYSDAIILLNKSLHNPSNCLQKTLKHFDIHRHRIKTKTPDERNASKASNGPKTILLRPVAQKVLTRLKLESNLSAFTYSDAIEFLIKENRNIWEAIPDRLK